MVFALAIFGLWWAVRWDALLLVLAAQPLLMARQLVPFVRFDGYHVLADLVGVPDLFHHIKPTLLGLLPTRWGRSENKLLKPWVRAVISLWVFVTIPLLAAILGLMIVALPRDRRERVAQHGHALDCARGELVVGRPGCRRRRTLLAAHGLPAGRRHHVPAQPHDPPQRPRRVAGNVGTAAPPRRRRARRRIGLDRRGLGVVAQRPGTGRSTTTSSGRCSTCRSSRPARRRPGASSSASSRPGSGRTSRRKARGRPRFPRRFPRCLRSVAPPSLTPSPRPTRWKSPGRLSCVGHDR